MRTDRPELVRRSRPAMGSPAEVFLVGDDEVQLAAAAEAALDEISRLADRWSRFSPASEISRINREAPRGWALVDRELFAVLAECDRWRLLTGGAFDITAGSWRSEDHVPPIGGADLELDAGNCAIRFRAPGLRLDLGGYGKGAALEIAANLLIGQGVDNALLQIGTSSVRALGPGPAGDGWPVALRQPDRPDQVVRELTLRDAGLSSSATLSSGQVQSDVVDPRTGEPLRQQRACCVAATTAAAAEALSTALLVLGPTAVARLRGLTGEPLRIDWLCP